MSLKLEGETQEIIVENALNHWINYFKNPISGFAISSKRKKYIRVIRYIFDERDAPKFDVAVADGRVRRFEQEVLNHHENLE